jgi:hypothetical protein
MTERVDEDRIGEGSILIEKQQQQSQSAQKNTILKIKFTKCTMKH